MKQILIVDDEGSIRESIKMILGKEYELFFAEDGKTALDVYTKEQPDMVLLDITMPCLNGIQVLKFICSDNPRLPVIMLTASSMLETAVKAIKIGAAHYLVKPFNLHELRLLIVKTFHTSDLEQEVAMLRSEIKRHYGFDNIIGKSKVMQEVYKTITMVADTKATVLITGSSGTGKELVARAIHYNSNRQNKPFIAINCAAMPDTLAESELFGHEKGAFTDATAQRIGRFESAHAGTLFLDEIADLSPAIQAKILRAIQEKEINRVGGGQTIKINVRLIAATNKNLEQAVQANQFRADLYYRINVVPIHLPPLNERADDIPLLIKYFLKKKYQEDPGSTYTLTPETIDILKKYHWPGNIRELENILEQLTTMATSKRITPADIPVHIRSSVKSSTLKENVFNGSISFEHAVMEFEKEIILEALKKCNYIQTHTSELLGTTRRILKYKMNSLSIDKYTDRQIS